jgi:hypothetical protein
MWISELGIEDLAWAADLPLSQARRWVACGALRPMRQEARRRHVFHRDEAVLAAVIKRLQEFLGEKSVAPLAVAELLRRRIAGWLRPDPPHYVEPLVVTLPARGVALKLEHEDVAALVGRMNELTNYARRI